MLATILCTLGFMVMVFSFTMFPPLILSYYFQDGAQIAFTSSMTFSFIVGFFSWVATRKQRRELRTRDGFLLVFLFWVILCLIGAFPFYLFFETGIGYIDALFESTSGFTTTGASILKNIDILPPSIIYYRQQLQFLGGMGIIVLAVAILPMLGVGGLQLFRIETTGPVKDNKLTPRIAQTAKVLWFIYAGITVMCILTYWFLGMSFFDAVSYAFGTVSTGGYAPHNASLSYYPNSGIYLAATVFMLFASINFSLHFLVFQRKNLSLYIQDTETRTFIALTIIFSLLIFIYLGYTQHNLATNSLLGAIVQFTSMVSTTGFTIDYFSSWPAVIFNLVFILAFIGGCSGSTSGGLKIVRILLFIRQGIRELHKLIHPNASLVIKLNKRAVPDKILNAVWGFLAIYILLIVVFVTLLMFTGLSLENSIYPLLSCFSNIGPGYGLTAANFASLTPFAKILLIMAMVIGRLEVFTVLVLLTPTFWRS